ncbi:hypothetical protein JOC34_002794 [Virgibacillus halotolerans]|nr:hypothetical protein [Virgibacillus halotolerans]MBM7600403.1 hypothetical protein [Virgibacillus halotolerans]
MKGKLAVGIIVLLTIIVLAFSWLWLQNIIDDYDIERSISTTIEDIF